MTRRPPSIEGHAIFVTYFAQGLHCFFTTVHILAIWGLVQKGSVDPHEMIFHMTAVLFNGLGFMLQGFVRERMTTR